VSSQPGRLRHIVRLLHEDGRGGGCASATPTCILGGSSLPPSQTSHFTEKH